MNQMLPQEHSQPTPSSQQTNVPLISPPSTKWNLGELPTHSTLSGAVFSQGQFNGIPCCSCHQGFAHTHHHESLQGEMTVPRQRGASFIVHIGHGTSAPVQLENWTNSVSGFVDAGQIHSTSASITPRLSPLNQPFTLVGQAAIVNTCYPTQHGGASHNTSAERWTDDMDKRLLTLKDQKMTHKDIVKVLKTEFPLSCFQHLNGNIISKRLTTLIEGASDPTKLRMSVDRLTPALIPLVANEFSKLAAAHGYEHMDREDEEIELETRKWCTAMFKKRLLSRKRAQGMGMTPEGSQQQPQHVPDTF